MMEYMVGFLLGVVLSSGAWYAYIHNTVQTSLSMLHARIASLAQTMADKVK